MVKIENVMMTIAMPMPPSILTQVGRLQQSPTYDMQHTQLLNIVRVTIIPVFWEICRWCACMRMCIVCVRVCMCVCVCVCVFQHTKSYMTVCFRKGVIHYRGSVQ